ncbi:Cyclin-like protein [Sarocladium implicatum]|nr:Cyclin-like protein [Sarocladium implicatum]
MRRQNHPQKQQQQQQQRSYRPYRALSNLPTPPPTAKSTSPTSSPTRTHQDGDDTLDPRYRGPAIHLANLVPCAASLATASVPVVQSILARACLPLEIVALAVCILDSLDARFARNWRLSCPLRGAAATTNKRHTLPAASTLDHRQIHIDSVGPEVIVLAALVIASKFTDDLQASTLYYCRAWASDSWTHEQLNATERCIMASLDYRILTLCDEDCLTDAMVDMQLAAQDEDEDHERDWPLTPPDSGATSEDDFVPCHSRSRTVAAPMGGFLLD